LAKTAVGTAQRILKAMSLHPLARHSPGAPRLLILCGAFVFWSSAGLAAAAQSAHPTASPSAHSAPASGKAKELHARVERDMSRAADAVDGAVGYAVLDLTSGERFERQADQPFPTASTIKLAILYELVRQVDEGRVKLDEPRPIDARHRVGGSGILFQLAAPVLSLRDCAILMMMVSDNTATNVVIDAVGLEAVTRRMQSLGLASTRLRRRMMDAEAARRGDENVASPADLVRLLLAFEKGEGLSASARETAFDIMTRPLSSALRRAVPAGTRVASKPGGLEGVAVDAGIVYVKDRPFAIAVMTTFLASADAGQTAITEITRAAYGYFDRLSRAGVEGRLLDR
jgi:beta-lactamase class A